MPFFYNRRVFNLPTYQGVFERLFDETSDFDFPCTRLTFEIASRVAVFAEGYVFGGRFTILRKQAGAPRARKACAWRLEKQNCQIQVEDRCWLWKQKETEGGARRSL